MCLICLTVARYFVAILYEVADTEGSPFSDSTYSFIQGYNLNHISIHLVTLRFLMSHSDFPLKVQFMSFKLYL